MKNLFQIIYNLFLSFHIEHETKYSYNEEYTSYEIGEEAYIIATGSNYGEGVYYNEHNIEEFFVKKIMDDGEFAIGFDESKCVSKTLYVATDDGGMVKDNETWVSTHQAEIYLTNSESFGYIPFNLFKIETDNKINVILWYRLAPPPPEPIKKPRRKKKNVQ